MYTHMKSTVTFLQEACYPYWPVEQGEIGVYGKLQVTLQSEEPGKEFTVRKFEIKEEKVYTLSLFSISLPDFFA